MDPCQMKTSSQILSKLCLAQLSPMLTLCTLFLFTCLGLFLLHPSHPSRAVHLYLSETSIEIDSSDGMISDPSTGDEGSEDDDEDDSDDDDDEGDDSD